LNNSDNVVDLKKIRSDGSKSALRWYSLLMTGSASFWHLLRYELIMFICSGMFGGLGIACRRFFYRFLLKEMGKNVTIGRNVCIRGGIRISIGNNVMIDDDCVIDARGKDAEIVIEDDVLISGATVIRSRNGYISIGRGTSLGRSCILGSEKSLVVGPEVLFGAFSYVVAAGFHRFDNPDLSIIAQGFRETQGVEIGEGSWLGTRATVLDGCDVGYGAVVGAHALVTKDIPAMAIAYGCPARVMGERPKKVAEPVTDSQQSN